MLPRRLTARQKPASFVMSQLKPAVHMAHRTEAAAGPAPP